jgi:hypothetical protein
VVGCGCWEPRTDCPRGQGGGGTEIPGILSWLSDKTLVSFQPVLS